MVKVHQRPQKEIQPLRTAERVRAHLSCSVRLSWDSRGRMKLPPRLLKGAGVSTAKLCVVVGMESYFEVWKSAELEAAVEQYEHVINTRRQEHMQIAPETPCSVHKSPETPAGMSERAFIMVTERQVAGERDNGLSPKRAIESREASSGHAESRWSGSTLVFGTFIPFLA